MIPFKKLEQVNKDQQYKEAVKRFGKANKDEQLRMLFEPFDSDPFGPIFNEHEEPPIYHFRENYGS